MEELDVSKIVIIHSDDEISAHDHSIQTQRPLCAEFSENREVLNKLETDVSKIVIIPSDEEISVHDNPIQTQRPLCTEFPENMEVLNKLEAVFNPLNVTKCSDDLFKDDYETIVKIEDLKKALSELLIRFDTAPGNYTKKDYSYLMGVIYKALLHLYEINPLSVIINDWSDTPREDRVPSEKLVAEKIGEEVEKISGDVFATNERLDKEIQDRKDGDNALVEDIQAEATARQQAIDDLLPLIYAGL